MLSEFEKITSPWCSFCKLHGETAMHLFYDFIMESIEINTIKKSYFSNKYTKGHRLCILGLRYELSPYLKPLTTYFQDIHLQCKNNRLLECKSSLIYVKDITDTEKKLCENDAKRRQKFKKKLKNILIN